MAKVEPLNNGLAGATEQTNDTKDPVARFGEWLKREGYAESTIVSQVKILKVLRKRGGNLYDSESIKEVIAAQQWSPGRKENAVHTYSNFLRMVNGKWERPRYRRVEKPIVVPSEPNIDQLIAGCGKRLATFLQLLKETGIRPGEAWQLRWEDFDRDTRIIRVTPEKGSYPRNPKLSDKLTAMIDTLPRKDELIFRRGILGHFADNFRLQRKRIAAKLENQEISRITFRSLRHFKATKEYARTRDIYHVMHVLGHKNIKNTEIYTRYTDFGSEEYFSKIAKTTEEGRQLADAGFDYLCTGPDDFMIFRKRK